MSVIHTCGGGRKTSHCWCVTVGFLKLSKSLTLAWPISPGQDCLTEHNIEGNLMKRTKMLKG